MKDWRIALAAAAGTAALIGTAQAITDTAFTYSTPKSGSYSISPSALQPDDSGAVYSHNGGGTLTYTSGGSGCFVTGVNLPQGARVVSVNFWYASGNGNEPAFAFFRSSFTANVFEGAQYPGSSDSGLRVQGGGVVPSGMATVNNPSYSYIVRWCAISPDNQFFGARINYTYSNAGS
jgi:hypothetical protein